MINLIGYIPTTPDKAQPTTPVAPVAPVAAAAPAAPAAEAPAQAQGQAEAPAAPSRPAPLQVDVAQGQDGVFIYTLKDPGTGTVLAVIPRAEMQPGRGKGQAVDRRV